jgi:hypothetical protein
LPISGNTSKFDRQVNRGKRRRGEASETLSATVKEAVADAQVEIS